MLSRVARPFRWVDLPTELEAVPFESPANQLAKSIEQCRQALAQGMAPTPQLKHAFLSSLAQLIKQATCPSHGDSIYRAQVLRYGSPAVKEFVALHTTEKADSRRITGLVDRIAHPAKLARLPLLHGRGCLTQWRASAIAADWSTLSVLSQSLLSAPEPDPHSGRLQVYRSILDSPHLERLRRLQVLRSDPQVQQYSALVSQNSPAAGSIEAQAYGQDAQAIGRKAEDLATHALKALAQRLSHSSTHKYGVFNSLRTPASLCKTSSHAKQEWDAVLLRQVPLAYPYPIWDLCLLLEAKTSVDSACQDFPRLRRGLALLAQAEANKIYPFRSPGGLLYLRGSSLRHLGSDHDTLKQKVLYCCINRPEKRQRLLGPACRMQLLSTPESLDYAWRLQGQHDVHLTLLKPIWTALTECSRFKDILNQLPAQQQARELITQPSDLLMALDQPESE